ncbi:MULTISPECIES: hypothetical protein [unclassified Streptomyces]|uniref:hypothetical protein n=1 Tax=unclassified Streptomyces TaxID=2593676 RepID=UPI0022B6D5B8|nr:MULTISPECIES: hypothetical protein [unclassified Streptomyces]MCZ7416774.1 hypothetical protein [Streptomyces sp. WMMC897]MCZ7433416.1 hypothetical protein [Streptomyces sp. WMMC1477]
MLATRLRTAVVAGPACALVLALGACSATDGSAEAPAGAAARPASWSPGQADTASALLAQANALRESAPPAPAAPDAATSGQCTTDPADRPRCTMPPGAEITPDGGDLDGDGVFEPHEPVGPGHRDPRAYDGGPTSGETQCDWLRRQGHPC